MRRLALLTCALALAGAIAVVVLGASAQGSSSASFDVIFDDARGLVAGQLVKVAGAQAGTINNVTVTKDFKARVEASIDSKFMPLRRDATCTIRPQGLIAEYYVECDPGTPGSPALTGNPPTVPVTHTTEPVALTDLFNIFNLPTRERFQVLVNELGIGTAGRGDDFNDILRRANPALQLADRTIGILNRQKAQLAQAIDATNSIAAEAAGHTATLQDFLGRAAALTQQTAAHSTAISQTIARLPGLLSQMRPALGQLGTVASEGTPLLSELRAAVPGLNRVADDLVPFVAVARPGLNAVSRAIVKAIPAIRLTTPVIRTLRSYTSASLPSTRTFSRLIVNLQAHGFVENFLSVVYYIGTALAQKDSTSHLLSALPILSNAQCQLYATTPVAGCSAHYSTVSGAAAKPARTHGTATGGSSRSHSTATPAAGASTTPTTTTPKPSLPLPGVHLPALPGNPAGAVNSTVKALQNLLGYLTR
jgi:phospholipid/cholesterol/gamma-HCH transport system substrate-binding protein